MQGLVLVLLALLALTHAQAQTSVPGGCCFYTQPNYKGDATCTNSSIGFDLQVSIQSMFCVRQYSAAVFDKANLNGDPIALVGCGEEVPTLLQSMPVNSIAVGPCAKISCCFYTGANFDEAEYCVAGSAAPPAKEELAEVQKEGKFKSMRCTAGNTARLTYSGGAVDVPCGGEVKPSGSNEYVAVAVSACTGGARAFGDEAVEGFGDLAVDDQAMPVEDALAADQAVSDEVNALPEGDVMSILPVDQAVADEVNALPEGDVMSILPVEEAAPVDQAVGDEVNALPEGDVMNILPVEQAVGDEVNALPEGDVMNILPVEQAAPVDQAVTDDQAITADQLLFTDESLVDDNGVTDDAIAELDQALVDTFDQAVETEQAIGAEQAVVDDQAVVDMAAEGVAVDAAHSEDFADVNTDAADQDLASIEAALADQAIADEAQAADEALAADQALTADEAFAADQALADYAVGDVEAQTGGAFSVTASLLVVFVSILVSLL